jgi:hypothetical protein
VPTSTESSFYPIFCLINIGQSYVLSVSVYSGVAFQPAYCIVSLKNFTAASISSSVLKGTFQVNLWSMRYLKLGCFSWFSTRDVSVKGQNMILLQRSLEEYRL